MLDNPYSILQNNVDSKTENDKGEIKYFSHKGRIGRLRYFSYFSITVIIGGTLWWSLLFNIFLKMESSSARGFSWYLNDTKHILSLTLIVLTPLLLVIFSICLSLSIQRLHDLNRSGWFALLLIVPPINLVLLLILIFVPCANEYNNFGTSPKSNTLRTKILSILLIILWIFIGNFLYSVDINNIWDRVTLNKMSREIMKDYMIGIETTYQWKNGKEEVKVPTPQQGENSKD
jgi:uncharacterized membrane protein YhaH (DUF805 family)